MNSLEEDLIRAEQWHTRNEQLRRELEWTNRPKEVIRFHDLLNENINRMLTVANAGKIDYVTKLGGFRIYLVEPENTPSYRKNFEGQYNAAKEYRDYVNLNESLIGVMFYALRCREGLEKITSTNKAEIAIQQIAEISCVPFQTSDIPDIVRKLDDIRETYLEIKKHHRY